MPARSPTVPPSPWPLESQKTFLSATAQECKIKIIHNFGSENAVVKPRFDAFVNNPKCIPGGVVNLLRGVLRLAFIGHLVGAGITNYVQI